MVNCCEGCRILAGIILEKEHIGQICPYSEEQIKKIIRGEKAGEQCD